MATVNDYSQLFIILHSLFVHLRSNLIIIEKVLKMFNVFFHLFVFLVHLELQGRWTYIDAVAQNPNKIFWVTKWISVLSALSSKNKNL